MPREKQRPPKRWRSKEAREIAEAVHRAGGSVETTGGGHLRITGPDGTAFVASAPATGRQGGRAVANTLTTIERETGLRVAPEHAASRSAGAAKDRPGGQRQRPARRGVVTRWQAGETYGFVTGDDGRSWFVSRDSLGNAVSELPEGTQVTFSGDPKPKIGKAYPQAVNVRCAAPPGEDVARR